MCHSNCPFSIATPGYIWTELLSAPLRILLFHYTRKQPFKCHHIRHCHPLKCSPLCKDSHQSLTLKAPQMKTATPRTQTWRKGRSGRERVKSNQMTRTPDRRLPARHSRKRAQHRSGGPSRTTWPAEARCEPSGPPSLLPARTRYPFGPWQQHKDSTQCRIFRWLLWSRDGKKLELTVLGNRWSMVKFFLVSA